MKLAEQTFRRPGLEDSHEGVTRKVLGEDHRETYMSY